jgi:tripartite-type tricarboxylate transporter receptor subunit TctC
MPAGGNGAAEAGRAARRAIRPRVEKRPEDKEPAMIRRRGLMLAPAALAAPAAWRPRAASAQGAWPNRPIRMVIPWPPRQQTDLVGRVIAQRLTAALGVSVVPENRPGAGGTIGTDAVAKAAPDGYTLLSASIGPITFQPLVQRVPYDVERDFIPIITFGAAPFMLLVRPEFPATDARTFIAHVKANPGKYSFASSGIGGAQHMVTALFNARSGIDALHVPFQGSGPAMTAFIGGQVDYAIETIAGAGALVRQGSLRPLGQTFARPSVLLPGVPPLAEAADIPGYEVGGWNGLMVPTGTPKPIVDRLLAEVEQAMTVPEVRERFAQMGIEVAPRGPEGFAAMLRELRAAFGPLIRQLGIRAE